MKDSIMKALVDQKLYKQKILVTGGAGHVGSNLIEELVKDKNNDVVSLDNYFNGTDKNHIEGAMYIKGDTKDIFELIKFVPDIIYHLGEYARIAPSFEDVDLVFEMNALGTFKVLEFCRINKVKKLIYAASSTKFAIEGDGRHQNPYSFTKATNVDLVNDYGRWYDLNFAICYFYNAFGPRENGIGKYATLIAKFEQSIIAGEPLTVVMPGTQRRNFTYVKDLAQGLILAGEKGQGDGYNLANEKGYSVLEVAEAFGGRVEYIEGYPGRSESLAPSDKARRELGWETTIDVMDYISDFLIKINN